MVCHRLLTVVLDPLTQRLTVSVENRSRDTVQIHHCTFLTMLTGAQQPSYKACQPKLVPLTPGAVVTESYDAYPPYENPTVRVTYDLPGQAGQTLAVPIQLPSTARPPCSIPPTSSVAPGSCPPGWIDGNHLIVVKE